MSRRFQAVVTDIRLESREGLAATWSMLLDPTGFRAGETGDLEAVARNGARLRIRVSKVTEDADGTLWHTVEKPLAAGTDVEGTVDACEPDAPVG